MFLARAPRRAGRELQSPRQRVVLLQVCKLRCDSRYARGSERPQLAGLATRTTPQPPVRALDIPLCSHPRMGQLGQNAQPLHPSLCAHHQLRPDLALGPVVTCGCLPGVKADYERFKQTGDYDPKNPNGVGMAWTHNFLNQKVGTLAPVGVAARGFWTARDEDGCTRPAISHIRR